MKNTGSFIVTGEPVLLKAFINKAESKGFMTVCKKDVEKYVKFYDYMGFDSFEVCVSSDKGIYDLPNLWNTACMQLDNIIKKNNVSIQIADTDLDIKKINIDQLKIGCLTFNKSDIKTVAEIQKVCISYGLELYVDQEGGVVAYCKNEKTKPVSQEIVQKLIRKFD